ESLSIPDGIPPEFAAYLRGALAYHLKDLGGARNHWRSILEMGEKGKLHRGVWASYMIGKAYWLEDKFEEAIPWFHQAAEYTQSPRNYWEGPGLGASAHKWEAVCALECKHYKKSMHMLLEQYAAGRKWAEKRLSDAAELLLNEGNQDA